MGQRVVVSLLLLLLLSGATLSQPPPCPPGQRALGDGAGVTCVPVPPAAPPAVSPGGDEDRIIGGYPCVPMSQPWQALLYGPLRCGGVLVAPQWVVTAAHCNRRGLRVRLGEDDLSRREGTEQERRVVLAVSHPRFNAVTLDSDLALLKLDRPVAATPGVRPLPLPRSCAPAGASCLLSGWGTVTTPQVTLPSRLICAYVQLLSEGACRRAYPQRITPSMLCAGVSNRRVDSCQGALLGTQVLLMTSSLAGAVLAVIGCVAATRARPKAGPAPVVIYQTAVPAQGAGPAEATPPAPQ